MESFESAKRKKVIWENKKRQQREELEAEEEYALECFHEELETDHFADTMNGKD